MIFETKKLKNKDYTAKYIALASVILYSIWLFLPSVQNFLGAKFAILMMCIFFISTLFDSTFVKISLKEYIIKIFILGIVSIFYSAIYTVGFKNFILFLPQVFMLFFPILVFFYIKKAKIKYAIDYLFIITLITCLVTSCINVSWLFRYRLTLRYMAHGSTDDEYLRRAMSYGIGGFGFTYGLNILFIFMLSSLCKLKSRLFKFACIILLGVFALSIYKSRYFISLIIMLFGIIIFLLYLIITLLCKIFNKQYKIVYTITFCILSLLVLFIFRESILSFFAKSLHDYGLIDFSNKIAKIKDYLIHFDAKAIESTRISEYNKGIMTILLSPFIGIKLDPYSLEISRHSTFIDTFAGFGVPAGLFALLCFNYSLKGIYIDLLKSNVSIRLAFITLFLIFTSNTIIFSKEAFFICFLIVGILDRNLGSKLFKKYEQKQ